MKTDIQIDRQPPPSTVTIIIHSAAMKAAKDQNNHCSETLSRVGLKAPLGLYCIKQTIRPPTSPAPAKKGLIHYANFDRQRKNVIPCLPKR